MIKREIYTALKRIALAVTLAASSSLASAAVIHVAVDSGNFGVATGYLDMQMTTNAGPLTTALVSNMGGFDPSAFIDAVGVTQTADGYLFRNDTFGDVFHAVNFGGILSFDLTFESVIDPLGLYPSLFLVSAFDDNFSLLGNVDPARGSLAEFIWTPSASSAVDGNLDVSISDPSVTFVPEPAGSLLMGVGLAAVAVALRRRASAAVA